MPSTVVHLFRTPGLPPPKVAALRRLVASTLPDAAVDVNTVRARPAQAHVQPRAAPRRATPR